MFAPYAFRAFAAGCHTSRIVTARLRSENAALISGAA